MFNIHYAHSKIEERYNGWMNDYPANKDLYTITPYLRQIGLMPNDTIISIPDISHVSLYLMNQKGWTEYTDAHFNKGIPINYNADSIGIQSSISKGAKYLIVNGVEQLYKKPYLQSFATCLIGKYNKILIFKLKDKRDNFELSKRKIKEKYFCDAEFCSKNNELFVNAKDSVVFEFGITQSDSFAYSGKYSSRLNEANPYGMTIKIKNVKAGESFVISVWRKLLPQQKGTIIVQTDSYYNGEYTVEKIANGWEKISKEIFIINEFNGKELTIYLYNNEKTPAYFDDFEIKRYAAVNETTKY